MEAIRFLFYGLCIVVVCRGNVPDGHLLNRAKLVKLAEAELGVQELTGHNDGKRVEEYLAAVGLKRGSPWCASFVSWVYQQVGYKLPRTGWSPALFPEERRVKEVKSGVVLGVYFPDLKRIGHCGLVTSVKGNWVYSVEGNTNREGSREGNGVYRRMRHSRSIKCFADWMSKISLNLK